MNLRRLGYLVFVKSNQLPFKIDALTKMGVVLMLKAQTPPSAREVIKRLFMGFTERVLFPALSLKDNGPCL